MRLFRSAAFLVFAFAAFPVAADGPKAPPPQNQTYLKECGACHMAFAPQFLPQRSWGALMDRLNDHFGDDASLPDAKRAEIKDYLLANAADVAPQKEARKVNDSIPSSATPLRITETGRWMRKHDAHEVPPSVWSRPQIKSKANCTACHANAAQGIYEDGSEHRAVRQLR